MDLTIKKKKEGKIKLLNTLKCIASVSQKKKKKEKKIIASKVTRNVEVL